MSIIREHQIQLDGQWTEDDVNDGSPLRMTRVSGDARSTIFAVHTDQSGLVGLIRYLHGARFVLLSVDAHNPSLRGGSDAY